MNENKMPGLTVDQTREMANALHCRMLFLDCPVCKVALGARRFHLPSCPLAAGDELAQSMVNRKLGEVFGLTFAGDGK